MPIECPNCHKTRCAIITYNRGYNAQQKWPEHEFQCLDCHRKFIEADYSLPAGPRPTRPQTPREILQEALYRVARDAEVGNSNRPYDMAELLSDFGLDVHMVVAAIQIGHDERYLEYGAGTAFFPTAQAIEAGFEVLRIRRRGSSNEVRAGADVQAPAIAFTDEVRRRVFVVHGRNAALRKSMFDLLVSLGLDPIEWDDAIRLCGQGSPYVGDVIDRAMNHAVAIIVLLTGDDLAVLLPEFRKEGDPAHETCPTPQARPNVLFEAGMAFGKDSQRTILVQVGNVRPFSDIAGRHVVVLDNSPERRRSLADRLRTVGALVRPDSEVWLTAGDFSAVRQSETSGTYELTDEVIREKPDRVLLTAPGNLWHYDGLGFEVFARVMDEVVPNPVSF